MTAESAQFGVRTETNDDLDLVHASKNGDVAAFEQLVKRYDRKLLRIAQSVTHNREDSQDVVQETFLKVYQHLAEFRGNSQFSTWLIRITLNQSLMKLRKQRRTREVSLDEDFASGLRAARSRRPFNGTDGRSSEPEPVRGEIEAMASSVGASRTPEQILRQVSGICASRVNLL
jgi:RNA polymerase sigma factor (sigma-70 family)